LLPPAVKVRLAVNSEDEVKLLTASAKAQLGPDAAVKPWRDGNASGAGVMRRFLPPEDGGVDGSKPGRRAIFVRGVVPVREMHELFSDQRQFPYESPFGGRIWGVFAQPFLQLALEAHHPRDELLRGRYNKAVPDLVKTREACRDATNRLLQEVRNNKDFEPDIRKWIERAFPLYADQRRAEGNQLKLDEANRQIDLLWKESRPIFIALDGTRSLPLRRETVYQLGLCKQEQAERLQLQSELNPEDTALGQRAVDAWKEAANVWQQYLDEYGREPLVFAGNASGAAARALGRAKLLSGDWDGAVHMWRTEHPTTELEKVGRLYLAGMTQR
jgi:hypothetical protein